MRELTEREARRLALVRDVGPVAAELARRRALLAVPATTERAGAAAARLDAAIAFDRMRAALERYSVRYPRRRELHERINRTHRLARRPTPTR